jgi:hypothetical protein
MIEPVISVIPSSPEIVTPSSADASCAPSSPLTIRRYYRHDIRAQACPCVRLRATASACDVVPRSRHGSHVCILTVFVASSSTPRQHGSPSTAEQIIECCF